MNVLEWFQLRTRVKIPGAFPSRFWDTLVLQAGATEPAVFHAANALGLLHRSTLTGPGHARGLEGMRLDHLATQAYNKAIAHLTRPGPHGVNSGEGKRLQSGWR